MKGGWNVPSGENMLDKLQLDMSDSAAGHVFNVNESTVYTIRCL